MVLLATAQPSANAEKLAVTTLERRLAGIHHAHLDGGLKSLVRDQAVTRTMGCIKCTFGTQQC